MTFNLINIEDYLRKYLHLYDDKIINSNFKSLGYNSSFFVINMGNMLPFLAYLILLLLLTVATQKIKNKRFVKIRNYVAKNIMWGWMLGFISESFFSSPKN